MNKKPNRIYEIKVTLYHKVQRFSFDNEEIAKIRTAIAYVESATSFEIMLLEYRPEAIVISIKNVTEKEKETAIKTVAEKISAYMVVESEKVRNGLRTKRYFMFKGKEECPSEIIAHTE